ncbi:MAG: hypothetical protein FWF23_04160, partial [Alphaproteobacteria bacterium]|nr:hypothetical protein [Alphaproteobacteria bacterium]
MNKISNKNKELPRHLTRCLLRVFSSLIVILALLITDAQAANTARAVLDMGHTKDAMIFPTGTTAERPEPPELGMIRFNTDLNMFEGYTKRGWVGLGTLTPTPGKVTGKCGSANGSIVAKEPTTNLCETGTLSIVTPDRGAYMWSCLGSGGGEHAACLALRQENGTCGITQTNNQAIDMSSLNGGDLCSEGRLTAAGVSDNPDTWTWTCRGTNGGTSIDCTLSKAITGVCGSASGVTVTAAPTANLCSVGTASGVTTNTTTY